MYKFKAIFLQWSVGDFDMEIGTFVIHALIVQSLNFQHTFAAFFRNDHFHTILFMT